MKKKISLKGQFAKSLGKVFFCLVSLLLFYFFYISYNNRGLDSIVGNSYHGVLLVGNESKIKLNISFYKKENVAYIRLIQDDGTDVNYINAEMKIDSLLNHSMVLAKISSHKKGPLDKTIDITYTKKLVSAMLYIRNDKLFFVLNRGDFYIKTDKCNIKEMIFILVRDR